MKASLYDVKGTKKREVALPAFFDAPVRADLVRRAVEYERTPQPYGLYKEAGRRHSASGIISHKRHDWKGQYGRGIARTPRKILWRRGTQFNWVGAEVSNTRGGRRPHGPKPAFNTRRMNKKELVLALRSALAATAHPSHIQTRYAHAEKHTLGFPVVIESAFTDVTTKHMHQFIKQVFGPLSMIAVPREDVRAGRGKTRGRRYKRSAGALIIVGSKEKLRVGGVDVISFADLSVSDLYPLGRFVIMSERAVEEMQKL